MVRLVVGGQFHRSISNTTDAVKSEKNHCDLRGIFSDEVVFVVMMTTDREPTILYLQ
jgi:hypothetical protein